MSFYTEKNVFKRSRAPQLKQSEGENAKARVRSCDGEGAIVVSQLLTFIFALRRRIFVLLPSELRTLAPRPGGESAKLEVAPSDHHTIHKKY